MKWCSVQDSIASFVSEGGGAVPLPFFCSNELLFLLKKTQKGTFFSTGSLDVRKNVPTFHFDIDTRRNITW